MYSMTGTAIAPSDDFVFDFSFVHNVSGPDLRQRLGGKGAGIVEMRQNLGLPVPPGFILGTELCRKYLNSGWPDGLDIAINGKLRELESDTECGFGSGERPLLVSVRSGAPVSMPGMMDTVLNLGCNATTVNALAKKTGDVRFALDTWSRFCRMYAGIVLDISVEEIGAVPPVTAGPAELHAHIDAIHALCAAQGTPIPDDPRAQLRGAIEAVFRSSQSERARVYREREKLPQDIPTAVVVQAMVFGNMGASSGTGVAFTRNPSTGANEPYGDFLVNAQGEDVVAGIRNSEPLNAMGGHLPDAYNQLRDVMRRLERHYRDLCDVEFTVQEGRLHILQVRVGKRSARAAARIAVELVADPDIRLSRAEAVRRISGEQLRQLQAIAKVRSDAAPIANGVGAAPGAAAGAICLDPHKVKELAEGGQNVILVRPTTSPEDVHGMVEAAGIVTSTGGLVSHAALVARGWGIAAVCGVESIRFEPQFRIADELLREGDIITIDGDAGTVYLGNCIQPGNEEPTELHTLRLWSAELGIELGGDAAKETTETLSPNKARSIDGFDLVRAISLLGFANEERVATTLFTDIGHVRDVLGTIPADLLGKAPRGMHVTPPGHAWLKRFLDNERERVDQNSANAMYQVFMGLDARFKKLVTDWQVKTVNGHQTPNDHLDVEYDNEVRRRLASLHAEVVNLTTKIGAFAPRLCVFADRFERALTAVVGGDGTMIASPLKDSYHTVWFELHEELIHLSGRNRAAEEAKAL